MTDHPRQQLQHIILHYGRSICDDPKRCEALLRDLCPDNRREVHLLVMALKEGVARDLMDSRLGALPLESVMMSLCRRLQEHLGTAEQLAMWTVETWALALGLKSMAQKVHVDQRAVHPAQPSKPEALQAAEKQIAGWQKIGEAGEALVADALDWAAVKDKRNGLMWAVNPSPASNFPNPSAQMNWEQAHEWVRNVNKKGWCGFLDWRLPSKDELKTLLINEKQQGLHIRCDLFTDTPQSKFYTVWTSWPHAADGKKAWVVHFGSGGLSGGYKDYGAYVRVVRSCQ